MKRATRLLPQAPGLRRAGLPSDLSAPTFRKSHRRAVSPGTRGRACSHAAPRAAVLLLLLLPLPGAGTPDPCCGPTPGRGPLLSALLLMPGSDEPPCRCPRRPPRRGPAWGSASGGVLG